ncbi:DNA internalization-related competence protein ComEC/Rec2 [Priestia abyssalis]|uniref:DNA internalization-related competence protein ComEC/Rec2 n=1 Tax=Priestia abyssalis TaxID=1221450 RepID=UPI000994A2CF|nr:DNA internalization-related competence protein ComEC/Rec2 [Priestia abyssalis]
MIEGMKGYWVYTAVSVLVLFLCLAVKEPILWMLPAVYFVWMYRSFSHLIFYVSFTATALLSFHYIINEQQNQTSLSPSTTFFQGRISTVPDINGQTLSFKFRLSKETVIVRYTTVSKEKKNELQQLKAGLSCRLNGELVKPETERNAGVFNYEHYLYQQRIHWILQASDISVEQCREDVRIKDAFSRWRDKGLRFIGEHVDQPAAGMMQALIYGERKYISEETLQHYQEGGVIHLLAISGLHVGFLAGMIFYVLIRLGVTRERATAFLLLILPFYAIIAGAAPSVIRAVMMTVLVLMVLFMKTAMTPHDAISLTFLLMLAADPYYIYHIGFQLSFVVSFFLIMSHRLIENTSASFWHQLLAASIVSQLSSLPLILYHFYQISLLSLPLNLLFIPLFSMVILPACLCILCLLMIVPFLGETLSFILNMLLDVSDRLVAFAVTFPYTRLIFGQPSLLVTISLYIGMLWLFAAWESNGKHRVWAGSCLVLLMLFQYYQFDMSAEGRVTVIDVGQGDSILIELPYRKGVYLVDTGGKVSFEKEPWQEKRHSFEVGKDVLLPFFYARGIRQIDKLFITHGDYDHAGAAETILNNVKVQELVIGKKDSLAELEKNLVEKSRSQGIDVILAEKGDMWREGNFSFYVLSPTGNEKSKNDQSLVLYTKLGGLTWLFTGDLELSGEEQLVKDFPALRADILKVGHHGSKTSSSSLFLDHIKPKAAIISVGKHNRYQHPHSSVIEEFEKRKILLFRTDEDGAVYFRFRQNKGTFHQQIP